MGPEVAMSEELFDDLADLADKSASTVYVVGGYLRDRLLGREPIDLDLLVEGSPEPFLAALSRRASFEPVVFSRREPVTYRVALGEWLIDVSACPPGGLKEAVSRRDFTINALAAPLRSQSPRPGGGRPSSMIEPVLDLMGGLDDLHAHRIRHITAEGLVEDPLRLLRAVRLAVILDGFTLDPALRAEIGRQAAAITTVAAERVLSEMEVILACSRAGSGLRLMMEAGLLYPILPELAPLEGLRQNRWHRYDALEHTIRTVEEADRLQTGAVPSLAGRPGLEAAEILKWAALLHDVGKAATASVGDDGEMHFYGHETVSAEQAATALARMRMGSRKAGRIHALIANHLRLTLLSVSGPASDRSIRRLVHQMKSDTPLLCLLALADRRAGGGQDLEAQVSRIEALTGRIMSAFQAEGDRIISPPPLLTGREIMQALGLQPGPPVGALLRWLTRLQVEDKIHTRDEALDRIRSLPPSRILTLEDEG